MKTEKTTCVTETCINTLASLRASDQKYLMLAVLATGTSLSCLRYCCVVLMAEWGKGLCVSLQGLGSVLSDNELPQRRSSIQRPYLKHGCWSMRKEVKVSNHVLHLCKVVKT